jgi:hypothetical protein
MAETVAVLGTGIVGAGIGQNVIRNGFAVRVWNRMPNDIVQQTRYRGAGFASVVRLSDGHTFWNDGSVSSSRGDHETSAVTLRLLRYLPWKTHARKRVL